MLLPTAGADGGDTKARWPGEDARGAHCGRPNSSDGGEAVLGAGSGAIVPRRLLRLSTGAVGAGCSGQVPGALPEEELGDRPGHKILLRQPAMGPRPEGGGPSYGREMDSAVCAAVADDSDADGRRQTRCASLRESTG